MNKLSENILKIRKKTGLSQEEFGDKVGVSRQTISKWELGIIAPKANRIEEICKKFGLDMNEVFKEEEPVNDNVIIDRDKIRENLKAINQERANQRKNASNINNTNSTIPVAKHITFKGSLKVLKHIILTIIIVYLVYCIYRFAIMLYITKRVAQYKDIDNYYCKIKSFGANDSENIKKIWYKDGIYKIVDSTNENETSKIFIHWINLNANERYEYDAQTKDMEKFDLSNDSKYLVRQYINGGYMYNNFPLCIRWDTFNIFLFSIKFNKTYLKLNNDVGFLYADETKVQFIKQSFLPICISETTASKADEEEGMRYYEINLNIVSNNDVDKEKITEY